MTTKRLLQVIRFTAKLLLLVVPAVLVTGFLTAKPYLWESASFATFRRAHTTLAPVLFIPLVYVHSLAGIRYLLARTKKLDSPAVRWGVTAAWTALVAAIAALYLAEPPTAEGEELSPAPDSAAVVDGGSSLEADAEGRDAGGSTLPEDGGAARHRSAEGGGDAGAAAPELDPRAEGGGDAGAAAPEPAPARSRVRPAPSREKTPPAPSREKTRAPPPTKAPHSKSTSGSAPEPSQDDRPDEAPPVAVEEPPPAEAPPSGRTLVAQRCAACHPVSTVYAKRRSGAEWQSILSRMVAMGAKLSADERRAVIRHLASR